MALQTCTEWTWSYIELSTSQSRGCWSIWQLCTLSTCSCGHASFLRRWERLVKLPASYRDGFVKHCLSRGILITGTDKAYTLLDLSAWLQLKSQVKHISRRSVDMFQEQMKPQRKGKRSPSQPSSSVYYNTSSSPDKLHFRLTSPSH